MRHINLPGKTGIPAPTIPVVGMEVIKIGISTFAFGRMDEQLGVIREIFSPKKSEVGAFHLPFNGNIASVKWEDGKETDEILDDLVAYNDIIAANVLTDREPRYRVDQVLFIKPSRESHPGPYFPSVGSPFERDIKITKVEVSRFHSVIIYQAYVPSVGYLNFQEDSLMTAKEREKYLHHDLKEFFFVEDALPFFRRGERVKAYDGYLYNQDETVIVKLNPELQAQLSWSIKQ